MFLGRFRPIETLEGAIIEIYSKQVHYNGWLTLSYLADELRSARHEVQTSSSHHQDIVSPRGKILAAIPPE